MPKTTYANLVKLKKAQGVGGKYIPSFFIEIETELEAELTLEESRVIYQSEAKKLADALFASLPGGTIDALMVEMMTRKVSLLAIPFKLPE
jgi:hypothetical protein